MSRRASSSNTSSAMKGVLHLLGLLAFFLFAGYGSCAPGTNNAEADCREYPGSKRLARQVELKRKQDNYSGTKEYWMPVVNKGEKTGSVAVTHQKFYSRGLKDELISFRKAGTADDIVTISFSRQFFRETEKKTVSYLIRAGTTCTFRPRDMDGKVAITDIFITHLE